jgi:hydroxyacylglutathione hydrolase
MPTSCRARGNWRGGPGLKIYLSALGESEGWGYDWPRHSNADFEFLKDGDSFSIGELEMFVRHTPGHTPEHITLLVREPGAPQPIGALTGDFLFVGRARPARPAGGRRQRRRHDAALGQGALCLGHHVPARGQRASDLARPRRGLGLRQVAGQHAALEPRLRKGGEPGAQGRGRGEDAFVDHILGAQTEPPMYFARMKKLNKEGPPRLGRLPVPDRMGLAELARALKDDALTFLDTRTHRGAVLRAHLPGALFAPLNAMFATVVGSLIADSEAPIVLVVQEADVEEATRRLVRIGYDNVAGFVEPETLQAYFDETDNRATIAAIDFAEAEKRKGKATIVDVRSGAERQEGHVRAPSTRPIRGFPNMSMTCRRTASFWCTAGRAPGRLSRRRIWRARGET